MKNDLLKLRRLIKTTIHDEMEAIRLYEKTIKELEVTAESHARAGSTDSVVFLGLARNMEMIRNDEIRHYNYLRGLKV